MKSIKRHTVTAALPYVNGPIHFGHLAGCYLPSDIYVRYLRSKGEEVLFICGSDENGMAITLRALKEGKNPEDIINKYHPLAKEALSGLGISFDWYSRTSSPIHHKTASDFFQKLDEDGILILKKTKNLYDEEYNQFLADRYVKGRCPKCGHEEAYGDQCENCGSSLQATDLEMPVSTLSGKPPVLKETTHWYFPLDRYQEWLEKWILEDHQEWKANVYGQCKSWLDAGLQPRAVTRDLDWGVPVPREDAEGKVLYVWFDAPIGYISSTKEWASQHNEDWEKWWKDEETKLVHFIGKDNIVFHCIFFPSMLKAHGDYILPENVPANEFLNLEGRKLSTSKNWAVWLNDFLTDFPNKEDVLRYVLCANMPEAKDADFSWKDFQQHNNSELVGIIGNLVNRIIVLTRKYFDGKLPAPGELRQEDQQMVNELKEFPNKIGEAIEKYRFKEGLQELMNLGRLGNKFLTDNEPWKTIKTDEERTGHVLHLGAQIIANLAILMEPFMPFSSKKLISACGLEQTKWSDAGGIELVSKGFEFQMDKLLFEKIDDQVVEQQRKKLEEQAVQNEEKEAVPLKEEIDFNDFTKLDMRIGKITGAEKVPKTKKLFKIEVDLGFEKRTVVSGIAEHFKPEDIVGKQVTLLANLAPRKIRGIESRGMILMVEDQDGALKLLSPEEEVANGSTIA